MWSHTHVSFHFKPALNRHRVWDGDLIVSLFVCAPPSQMSQGPPIIWGGTVNGSPKDRNKLWEGRLIFLAVAQSLYIQSIPFLNWNSEPLVLPASRFAEAAALPMLHQTVRFWLTGWWRRCDMTGHTSNWSSRQVAPHFLMELFWKKPLCLEFDCWDYQVVSQFSRQLAGKHVQNKQLETENQGPGWSC